MFHTCIYVLYLNVTEGQTDQSQQLQYQQCIYSTVQYCSFIKVTYMYSYKYFIIYILKLKFTILQSSQKNGSLEHINSIDQHIQFTAEDQEVMEPCPS